jgi:hypothetical protein
MSHYIMIRRLRFPAILLLLGVIALLNETGVIDQFWQWFVPLLLILLGVIMLAERAALAVEGGYPPFPGQSCSGQPYPGQPCSGAPDPRTATGVPPYPGQPQAFIPPQPENLGKDPEGGQL